MRCLWGMLEYTMLGSIPFLCMILSCLVDSSVGRRLFVGMVLTMIILSPMCCEQELFLDGVCVFEMREGGDVFTNFLYFSDVQIFWGLYEVGGESSVKKNSFHPGRYLQINLLMVF